MKYNLNVPAEALRATDEMARLKQLGVMIELKKVSPRRSLNQNAYLHLLLGAFGFHFGYTIEEAKIIYKDINADIYTYTKNNRTFQKSSSQLTKEEMARTIDRFRDKSAAAGYPLPLATDQEWLREMENVIEQARHYL